MIFLTQQHWSTRMSMKNATISFRNRTIFRTFVIQLANLDTLQLKSSLRIHIKIIFNVWNLIRFKSQFL